MKAAGIQIQVLAVLAISAVLGLAANTWGPRRMAWREDWGQYVEVEARRAGLGVRPLSEVRKTVERRAGVVLDARGRREFAAGRLPGAISVPWREVDRVLPTVEFLLEPTRPILVYCVSAYCDEGLMLARHLHARGYRDVALYAGGWREWKAAGLPKESGP
jgi:rhodanese-related sulfurtransferase